MVLAWIRASSLERDPILMISAPVLVLWEFPGKQISTSQVHLHAPNKDDQRTYHCSSPSSFSGVIPYHCSSPFSRCYPDVQAYSKLGAQVGVNWCNCINTNFSYVGGITSVCSLYVWCSCLVVTKVGGTSCSYAEA